MDTTEKKTQKILQLVSFILNNEPYAVDVMKVRGIERMMDITSVPGMPEFLEGVVNIRDTIIPVIDLSNRFGLPSKPHDKETRIVLIEIRNGLLVGMVVDSVREVFQIDTGSIGGVPRIGKPRMDTRFILGVAKKESAGKGTDLIIILDPEMIFSEDETKDLVGLH